MTRFIIDYTIESNNGVSADFELTVNYIPGEREVRYTRNGDGYPGSPPEVEVLSWLVYDVSDRNGNALPVPKDREPFLNAIIENWIDRNFERIYEDVCQGLADREEDCRW